MPPTSEHKPKQFAFVLSDAEFAMLEDLAGHEEMTKASLVRLWIRSKYLDIFPDKRPGADVPATLQSLIAALTAPEHRTVRHIAARMKVTPGRLLQIIERVSIKTDGKVFECVDGKGPDATWELSVSREKARKAIEDAGFDLGEPFVAVNPDAEK